MPYNNKVIKENHPMLTVNLTEEQLNLLYDLVGEKFNEVSQAWLPAEKTEEMNKLSYDTLLNLRAVKGAKQFDEDYADIDNEFLLFDKAMYLKEVHLVTVEALAQQGIPDALWMPYNNKVIKETTSDPPDLQRNSV
jgi:hypothetical protein